MVKKDFRCGTTNNVERKDKKILSIPLMAGTMEDGVNKDIRFGRHQKSLFILERPREVKMVP